MKLTHRILFFLCLLLALYCKKEDKCNKCPFGRTCVESACECKESLTPIGDKLCAYPNSFIAYGVEAWNCAPDTFMIHFRGVGIDSLGNSSLGPFATVDGLVFAPDWSTPNQRTFKYIDNGPGLTGDQFFIYATFGLACYPSGQVNGKCFTRLTGTFIHPDTISALFTMENCTPEDLPEAQNQLRIMLYRVRN
jgi:hypothetical protein